MKNLLRPSDVPVVVALLASLILPAPVLRAETPKTQLTPEQQVEMDLVQGKRLLAEKRYKDAATALRKADKLSGGRCAPCLIALAGAYSGMEQYQQAIDRARKALEMPLPQSLRALAYNEYGAALAKDDPARNLKEAEPLLRNAIELGGGAVNVAHYNLAEVYRRQGRYAEAVSLARTYLANEPQGFVAIPARLVICRSAEEGSLPRPPVDLSALPKPDDPDKALAAGGVRVPAPRKLLTSRLNLGDEFFARARGTKVKAIIDLAVATDSDGCVRDVQVVRGPGNDIEKATVQSVRNWIFEPPVLDGRPVAVSHLLEFRFNVR